MGVRASLDIEGMEAEDVWDYPDGKGLLNLLIDCDIDEDNLVHQLAKKYSFSLEPFRKLPKDEDAEGGPWQDPATLRRSAIYFLHAFKKEGNALVGKEVCYTPMEKDDLEYYMYELRCVITLCRIAIENKKRIRLTAG